MCGRERPAAPAPAARARAMRGGVRACSVQRAAWRHGPARAALGQQAALRWVASAARTSAASAE
eukprot:scaffold2262_cov312-Prasinococcus_capsulatus_cf.AAC.6